MVADGSWDTDVKRRMTEFEMRRVDVDAGIWETKSDSMTGSLLARTREGANSSFVHFAQVATVLGSEG